MKYILIIFVLLVFGQSGFAQLCHPWNGRSDLCPRGFVKVKEDGKSCFTCEISKKFPMITEDGEVCLGPMTVEGVQTVYDCHISSVGVKYFGTMPVCQQDGKCKMFTPTTYTDIKEFVAGFTCPIASAEVGCAKTTWQQCAIDESMPESFTGTKCLTDKPGPIPPECPKPQGHSGNSDKANEGNQ